MATKKTTTARKTNATKTTAPAVELTKSDHMRDWFKANPEGSAVDCQKAMKQLHGFEVGSSHCQQVKNKMFAASNEDDARKAAVEFAKNYESVEEAVAAVETVGNFISTCGGAKKATAALEFVQQALAFAESLKK